MNDLLTVENLHIQFPGRERILYAVNGASFQVKSGETLGIVGESGCGKSVSMLSILRLISQPPAKITSDKIVFQQEDLTSISDEHMRQIRGSKIGIIFQDPITSLNPILTIGRQVSEPLFIHTAMKQKEALDRTVEILSLVGIPKAKERLSDYPHQFSGGMRQRVMIAMALICNPQLLIADEPTTALDVTIQAQIIELVKKLRDDLGMAVIWITHDLGVVAGLADRVSVMYGGMVVEEALVDNLYREPMHPYTVGLLNSLPKFEENNHRRLASIKGTPPTLHEYLKFCPFAVRCPYVQARCQNELPPFFSITTDHKVACWFDIANGRSR